MIVIGIVGSPAGGKSTVAAALQALGATWIDADRVARDVLDRAEIQRQLIDHFGSEITDKQGRIDRGRLAARVFGDDAVRKSALKYLESVIHPQTRRVIASQLQAALDQGVVAAVLDVPLLFESGWDRCCDEVWCVDSPRKLRAKRAASRGWDEDELDRRERNQLPITEKRRLCTWSLINDGPQERLTETIRKRWSSLLQRQNAHSHASSCPTRR